MSPRWNGSNRVVSLSTRTYSSGSSVRSIDVWRTWNGWATNDWMTTNVMRVRPRVSTTSMSQRGGRIERSMPGLPGAGRGTFGRC